jgi:formylglycine-generating enzyme required for sulfatase activity
MAPEQACNSGRTDIRSDVYSLGCTFYCLLAGHPPFAAASLLEVMVQHLQSVPPPVSRSRPDVPAEVVAILERMLAKRPEQRYQEPAEVARALEPWAAPPSRPPSLAVVPAGAPLDLYPATQGSGTPQVPTTSSPTPTAATVPTAPGPSAISRAVTATARAFFGCFLLFLLLLAAMIAGLIYLLHGEHNAPPPEGSEMVPLPAVRFVPSYATAPVEVRSAFAVATREVTRRQFAAFAEAAHYRTAAEKGTDLRGPGALVFTADGGGDWDRAAAWNTWRPDLPAETPVVCVSWDDAVQFCNWLSEREKLPRCYAPRGGGWDCNFLSPGYRLPTEAEWEYAAGGGEPALYPERDLLDYGWFRGNAGGRPHPAGDRKKTDHQLSDVWGNVWEWCWDPATTGDERVARGGGWCDPAPVNPAQTRKSLAPDYRANDLGFRVVRTVSGP